jgi:hypothetical protein
MSIASDFFSRRGTSSTARADGLPSLPDAAGTIDPTGSSRHLSMEGTTDTIRMPHSNRHTSNPALGYRRIDKFEDGGSSEWIISWTEVAAFKGAAVGSVQYDYWHSCIVKGAYIYIGMYDINSAFGAAGSWVIKADVVTGAIISMDKLVAGDGVFSGLLNAFYSATGIMDFWEVLDDGSYLFYLGASLPSNAYTYKGIVKANVSSDGLTVLSSESFFATNSPSSSVLDQVSYATKDGEILVSYSSLSVVIVSLPTTGHVLTIYRNNLLLSSADFINVLANNGASTAPKFNMLSDSMVGIARNLDDDTGTAISNGYVNIVRPHVNREVLDDYLRQLVLSFSGIEV